MFLKILWRKLKSNATGRVIIPSVSISPFPNIIGTLIPAVRASLVHAVSAFRIAEKSTFTHKELANYLIYAINISVFPKQKRIITNILSSPHGFYLISDKLPRKLIMPIIGQVVNV